MPVSTIILGNSTDGKGILLSTSFSAIHTSVTGVGSFDQIFLWASNNDTVARGVLIGYGGQADPGDRLIKNQPLNANSGLVPVLNGQILQNGKVLSAAAVGAVNVVFVVGYVLRTTP